MMEVLKPLSSKMKIVFSHESSVKDVPVNEIIAAVGIKKCTISDMPEEKTDDNVKITTKKRTILVTVGINLYIPYNKGSRVCSEAFDSIFNILVADREGDLCESKLLSTKYSREAQCLVTETEFVFESIFTGMIEGSPPLVFG